jgi:hypothetical protein
MIGPRAMPRRTSARSEALWWLAFCVALAWLGWWVPA